MPVTTVTREQLYERLWQTPTVHLCKEFGLSDVGLAKLLAKWEAEERAKELARQGDGCRRRLRPACHLGRAAARAGPKAPVSERFGLEIRDIPTVYPQSLNQRRGRRGQFALHATSLEKTISASILAVPCFWRQVFLR
jgi:hypothetical protein